MGTSSCFHVTQVEEIKRIVGEAMYENEVVGPNGSPVSGGGGTASARATNIMTRGLMGSVRNYGGAGSTFTYHTTTTVEQHARRFRIWLPNLAATAVTVAAVAIAVSNAVGADPTVGSTGAARFTPSTNAWVAVTFNGSASATIPPAIDTTAGNKQPSWIASDWIDIATIPRTDGGTLPVVMMRATVTSGVSYNLTGYKTSAFNLIANSDIHGGRIFTAYRYTGDGITTPANFTYTTDMSGTGAFFNRFEYQGVSPGVTIAVPGDSIADGSVNGGTGNYGNGWAWKLANLLRAARPDLPIELCLLSFSSQNAVSFPLRAERFILDGTHFDIMIYSPFSPNDGPPNAATVLAQHKYWQQMAEMVVNGTYPTLKPLVITPGASPYTYAVRAPGTLMIAGGTVSAVSLVRAGVTVAMPIAGPVAVIDGDAVTITYTVAPTVTLIPAARPVGSKTLVLTTPCPNTAAAWDATADGFRLALKAQILAAKKAGVPVIDFDAVLSDGATPARFITTKTTDGTHPNEVGHTDMAAPGLPVVLPLLPTALA